MPLFMDIHTVDSDDFSVEDVVKAHMEDVAVQERFGVIQIKYWVDTDNKKIFCLMKGPSKEACNSVHLESHGNTACNIIEVSDDEYNLFLHAVKTKNDLAIRPSGEVDAGYRTLLMLKTYDFSRNNHHYNNKVHQIIKEFNGAIILQPNTDFMVSFVSSLDALKAAISISNLLKSIPDNYEFRIALTTGELVDVEGKKLFEDTKKRVSYLIKIGLKNTIYLDEITKKLVDKETSEIIINEKDFSLIDNNYFLFLDQLFTILKSELHKPDFKCNKLYTLLGLSKSQAYRKIKDLTGLPPNTLIRNLRLYQSLDEIKENNKTIAEISYDLGFNTPSYFTRIFRKKFNIIPSLYSKN